MQEELPQPPLPAANIPTLPAPQMQRDVNTQSETVVVADAEPSVIATAQNVRPKPLFLQGWERSRCFLVGARALTQEGDGGIRNPHRCACSFLLRSCQFTDMNNAQRLLRFGTRPALLRLRTSNGFGHGAPLICSEDTPAVVRRCSLKSSSRIAASCSRLVGCVIGHVVRRRSSENPHPATC